MLLDLRPDFAQLYGGDAKVVFARLMAIEGNTYREVQGRSTIQFSNSLGSFFIKIHRGVGWLEILKNIFQFRLPVLSGRNEWLAIRRLEQLGVTTMALVGYGCKGISPANLRSFVITEEIENATSLEDLTRDWKSHAPDAWFKYMLIDKVAHTVSTLHDNGVNHRDLYICHFLLDEAAIGPVPDKEAALHLIDLHRVQIRRRTPYRWRVKDLAALYFSAMDIGLSRRDRLRFVRIYRRGALRESLATDRRLWRDVEKRARRLYRSVWGRPAPDL